jgi:hypothetical protein
VSTSKVCSPRWKPLKGPWLSTTGSASRATAPPGAASEPQFPALVSPVGRGPDALAWGKDWT